MSPLAISLAETLYVLVEAVKVINTIKSKKLKFFIKSLVYGR